MKPILVYVCVLGLLDCEHLCIDRGYSKSYVRRESEFELKDSRLLFGVSRFSHICDIYMLIKIESLHRSRKYEQTNKMFTHSPDGPVWPARLFILSHLFPCSPAAI